MFFQPHITLVNLDLNHNGVNMNILLYQCQEASSYIRSIMLNKFSDEDIAAVIYFALKETYGIIDPTIEQRMSIMNFQKAIMIEDLARNQYVVQCVYQSVNIPPGATVVTIKHSYGTLEIIMDEQNHGTNRFLP